MASQIVTLITRAELQGVGSALDRAWPLGECSSFAGLLEAIDDADRQRPTVNRYEVQTASCEAQRSNSSA